MKNPKIIIALVLVVLVVILLFQNTQQVVTLNLFFWEISMSQIILIPLVLVLGFVAGYLVATFRGKARREREPGFQV